MTDPAFAIGTDDHPDDGSWIEPIDPEIHVFVEPQAHREPDERVEKAWSELCARNPRYHDGPILEFKRLSDSTIHAERSTYRWHAVGETVDTDCHLLSVTGVLIAPDDHGVMGVLLGKRGPETHRYQGRWEFGPAGGVEPTVADEIRAAALAVQLARETSEEIGAQIDPVACKPIALLHDDAVGSVDVVLLTPLSSRPLIENDWEYSETRWVSASELAAWIADRPESLIPPARVIGRWLAANRIF